MSRPLLLILLFIAVLHAENLQHEELALQFLDKVVGLSLEGYEITHADPSFVLRTIHAIDRGIHLNLTGRVVYIGSYHRSVYAAVISDSYMAGAIFDIVNGKVVSYKTAALRGEIGMNTNDTVRLLREAYRSIREYGQLVEASYYSHMAEMILEAADTGKTKIEDERHVLLVVPRGNYLEVLWFEKIGNYTTLYRSIHLIVSRIVMTLEDNMALYRVATTDIALSREDAVYAAMRVMYGLLPWLEVARGRKIGEISATLEYRPGKGDDTSLHPLWVVKAKFDEPAGEIQGLYAEIWADSGDLADYGALTVAGKYTLTSADLKNGEQSQRLTLLVIAAAAASLLASKLVRQITATNKRVLIAYVVAVVVALVALAMSPPQSGVVELCTYGTPCQSLIRPVIYTLQGPGASGVVALLNITNPRSLPARVVIWPYIDSPLHSYMRWRPMKIVVPPRSTIIHPLLLAMANATDTQGGNGLFVLAVLDSQATSLMKQANITISVLGNPGATITTPLKHGIPFSEPVGIAKSRYLLDVYILNPLNAELQPYGYYVFDYKGSLLASCRLDYRRPIMAKGIDNLELWPGPRECGQGRVSAGYGYVVITTNKGNITVYVVPG